MAVPGFVIKIHNSLTTPLLTAGVPRQFFILNGTLGAAIVGSSPVSAVVEFSIYKGYTVFKI